MTVGVFCGFVGVSEDICVSPSVNVNLCVVVCGCGPIINFVVAICCMYCIAVCHVCHEVCPGCHGLPLMFSIFCFVSVVHVVVHGLLAFYVVDLVSGYV